MPHSEARLEPVGKGYDQWIVVWKETLANSQVSPDATLMVLQSPLLSTATWYVPFVAAVPFAMATVEFSINDGIVTEMLSNMLERSLVVTHPPEAHVATTSWKAARSALALATTPMMNLELWFEQSCTKLL
jgi:hypothetical protein